VTSNSAKRSPRAEARWTAQAVPTDRSFEAHAIARVDASSTLLFAQSESELRIGDDARLSSKAQVEAPGGFLGWP
jgi:hypothetical protein